MVSVIQNYYIVIPSLYLQYLSLTSCIMHRLRTVKETSVRLPAQTLQCFTQSPSVCNVFVVPASAAFKSQHSEATYNRSHISTTRRPFYSEIQIRNVYSESFTLSTSCVIKPSVRFLLHFVGKRDYWKPDKLCTTKQLNFTIHHTMAEHFLSIWRNGACSLKIHLSALTLQNLNEITMAMHCFINELTRWICCFKMRYMPWVWHRGMSRIYFIVTNFGWRCIQPPYQFI